MNSGIEKRRHPRAQVWWPVILMSPDGSIMGTIRNISVSGAFFSFEPIENENEFQIMLKPPNADEMLITCKKVWSGKRAAGNSEYHAIGLLFNKISSSDREIIASLVADYHLLLIGLMR